MEPAAGERGTWAGVDAGLSGAPIQRAGACSARLLPALGPGARLDPCHRRRAYFSIPFALASFLLRRRDIDFGWMLWLFAAFILACGTTHFFAIWTLWEPDYGAEGLVKVATAMVSVITAVMLWPLLRRAVLLPSPAQLRQALAERDLAQAQLAQTQRLEAAGQLSGGIAHDFNNLLTIVVANLDRAQRLGGQDPGLAKALAAATAGAERAAKLTDQLLSFSRRQSLDTAPQDLCAIIETARDMAEAALPPGIVFETDCAEDLGDVLIDRRQAENAVLNLIVNARDAMPGGGRLTVRARNLGRDKVLLEVADTGEGMTAEIRARVFEPFFTTKDPGRGTGLGLSQVYGLIAQSNGSIEIDSEPGAGTTVRIVLPRAK